MYRILDQKIVITRCSHVCQNCMKMIPKATRLRVKKVLHHKKVWSNYECLECLSNKKVQLKIKTEYSFGQTFAPIDKIIARLKEIGCQAAGMVDNSTWGHMEWFEKCKKAGIQPLLGAECVVSDNEDLLKMWFLAKNEVGLSELYGFLSKSYHQTIKSRGGAVNRLYRPDVLNMTDNIFKFAGEVTDEAFLLACGAVIDFNPSSRILNYRKSQVRDLSIVSVSDNSYAVQSDKDIFELISKKGSKSTPQHILETLKHQEVAEGIAKACEGLELPKTEMFSAKGDLEADCRWGATIHRVRIGEWTNEYETRLKYELGLIQSKNFDSYFIIVADMVAFAKKHMLVGPSRGSAAGSLVCFLLGITEVDPIPSGLYFERFIDINRTDLPDIDLDFPDNKRQMVFDYMEEKYGNVAHIGTISKLRSRSALIKICKALNIPPVETADVKNAIIERMPGDARFNKCLEDTFSETEPGKEFIREYPEAIVASKVEGHADHASVHAAGLLICNDDIGKYATVDNKGIAHIDKEVAEKIGLLKIDILGLRTLTILEDSGVDIDWYNLKFDDPKVFDLFNSGKLCGIFQFEGRAMRNVSRDVTFKTIDDINVVTALARPGPLQSGIDKKFIKRMAGGGYHCLIPQLDETYGLPIYQEQTMAIVREIGGFDWTDTIKIRKLIAKSKGKEAINKYREKFMEGAIKNSQNETLAENLWEMIVEMGAYQMNKAHTYSYSVISYWTAYLKAHYPLEFLVSNLRHAKDEDSAIALLREMYGEGIEYVPFDIEKSEIDWCVKDGKIYGGFTALKGVGEVKAAKYIADRPNFTEKQLAFLNKAENVYDNLFPFHKNYQHIYDDPGENGIAGSLSEISELNTGKVPHQHERVFLCELIDKSLRSENETVRIKKRNGKALTGPMEYVNVKLRDDSGEIGGKIGRYDFDRIGKKLLSDVPVGSHLAVRAVFYHNIPWAFITKWRRIDE